MLSLSPLLSSSIPSLCLPNRQPSLPSTYHLWSSRIFFKEGRWGILLKIAWHLTMYLFYFIFLWAYLGLSICLFKTGPLCLRIQLMEQANCLLKWAYLMTVFLLVWQVLHHFLSPLPFHTFLFSLLSLPLLFFFPGPLFSPSFLLHSLLRYSSYCFSSPDHGGATFVPQIGRVTRVVWSSPPFHTNKIT